MLCFFCASLANGASAADTERPPNIVIFFSDDHGQLDSSVYGAGDVRTPRMERLAKRGVTFTQAFVASPACAPSRGALLTGLMPARNGAEANHTYPRDGIKTLPAYLKELGYEVAAFGKVAHGRSAIRYGFDRQNKHHDIKLVREYLDSRADSKKPLCLMVGTHPPHVPWPEEHTYEPAELDLPPTHVDTPETREMRGRYYEDVTTADREMGEIYDLARERFGGDMLFIYTSDHGAQWPFGKWNLYDAGIRVPLIAAWEGVIEPGSTSQAMVSWIDLLPTFIEIAGGQPPGDIDGKSFLKVLKGETKRHRDRVYTTHTGDGRMNIYPMRSLRTRKWKYIANLHPEYAYTTHIDQARGKDGLVYWLSWRQKAGKDSAAEDVVGRYHERPPDELYDLENDPHEEHNLATNPEFADRVAEFRDEVQVWMKKNDDRGKAHTEPRLLANADEWAPAVLAPAPPAKKQPGGPAKKPGAEAEEKAGKAEPAVAGAGAGQGRGKGQSKSKSKNTSKGNGKSQQTLFTDLIRRKDRNKDGKLTEKEFVGNAKEPQAGTLRKRFRQLDRDRDGVLMLRKPAKKKEEE